mmetsp:Transcript_34404/g.58347  ORF Transcript_34404/g.58347 Transcript_34404/m.58347 type:complete len:94 (+) Transcript_34404:212-493(+)
MILMLLTTIPTPGRKNLVAIRPNSNGAAGSGVVDATCASMTFRAKTNVMEDMTVRINWDHQENHEVDRRVVDVRANSGSMLEDGCSLEEDRWS